MLLGDAGPASSRDGTSGADLADRTVCHAHWQTGGPVTISPQTPTSAAHTVGATIHSTLVDATVTDDATLSEFGSAAESNDTGEQTSTSSEDDTAAPDGADSGLSAYAWGAYRCQQCDAETERVWRADGQFVCPACKRW